MADILASQAQSTMQPQAGVDQLQGVGPWSTGNDWLAQYQRAYGLSRAQNVPMDVAWQMANQPEYSPGQNQPARLPPVTLASRSPWLHGLFGGQSGGQTPYSG
jgi:hypothetical protein